MLQPCQRHFTAGLHARAPALLARAVPHAASLPHQRRLVQTASLSTGLPALHSHSTAARPCSPPLPWAAGLGRQQAAAAAALPGSSSRHRRRQPVQVAAAAASPDASSAAAPQPNIVVAAYRSVRDQFRKLDGLWDKFLPMSLLFFLMAFVNTIIDSLKDSLVITAVGGGTEVIPYLTVYAVLPSSLLFFLAYSWGTQRFSRERLFNIVVCVFLVFYGGFGLLYPHHELLHLTGLADGVAASLPAGLGGLVGMFRNWLFTLFYCVSELWGDVVLSLLFWGLANETTSIEDAPLLYPLFGVGANIAQTVAGRVLRVVSDSAGHLSYAAQLQAIMALCLGLGIAILGVHTWISRTFPKNPKGSTAAKRAAAKRVEAAAAASALAASASSSGSSTEQHVNGSSTSQALRRHITMDLEEAVRGLNYCDLALHASPSSSNGTAHGPAASTNGAAQAGEHRARGGQASTSSNGGSSSDSEAPPPKSKKKKKKGASEGSGMSLRDAFAFLKQSPQIRCLAVMALAQGITTNLADIAWKHYLHRLATTPAAYSAFLGDTAMWTGVVTGTLMFTSPMLFDRVGWRGVANATPNFMIWGGLVFFGGCIAFNFAAGNLAAASSALGLQALVIMGALLQVFSRGAKFSLFKPAEEMVYIGLDDESRTKGKAAIDVVGAQSGKSIGSMLQQALLILSGSSLGGILPVMTVFYLFMLNRWTSAVDDLAEHHDPSHAHRMSVAGSLDEDLLDLHAPLPSGLALAGSNAGEGSGSSDDSLPAVPSPAPAY